MQDIRPDFLQARPGDYVGWILPALHKISNGAVRRCPLAKRLELLDCVVRGLAASDVGQISQHRLHPISDRLLAPGNGRCGVRSSLVGSPIWIASFVTRACSGLIGLSVPGR